jgi:hypothetical protein
MRYPSLHVGDLVYIRGTDIMGTVVCERRIGAYDIHVFLDNRSYTFPIAMIKKLEPDKNCP